MSDCARRGSAGAVEPGEVKRNRALGDPTRWRIFLEIARLGRVTVSDLTAAFSLHHNGVRQHLERLIDAGLVRPEPPRRPLGPGRPPCRYALTAEGQILARRENPLADIVAVLIGVLKHCGNPENLPIEAAAAEVGRRLGEESPARRKGALVALYVHLEQSGCQPVVTRRGKSGFEIQLGRCPYRDAARLDAGIICRAHAGILQGFLEALPARCRLEALQPEGTEMAGCRVRVSAA